ncbi:hypothetical protein A0H81_09793 [Grifola frondosa]|uniref:Zn(2)-C6 fungal-type domain-containing protein n=1 Tax=Grifola frondosa TaxID=5627 RepID=A0A1C7M589_GRIFR|nr:hypothetical protein A0H81_09793 [Grifola frondosa]
MYSEPSDEDRPVSPTDTQLAIDSHSRRRTCDECRRTKSKCERVRSGPSNQPCRGCSSLGLACTFVGPSHKRGPPKGYILAIERRLHQVEALLGTVIGSEDPRARGLLQDLSQDKLASQIIQRVNVGPFGPKGRVSHPFGSTKEDFLASITTNIGEDASSSSGSTPHTGSLMLVSPSSDWQDNLRSLLMHTESRVPSASQSSYSTTSMADVRNRRASFPMMSNVTFPTKEMSPLTSSPSTYSFSGGKDGTTWDSLEKIECESDVSDEPELKVPVTSEDVYIDEDGQYRTASRSSGLHILRQCRKLRTGRREDTIERYPFDSGNEIDPDLNYMDILRRLSPARQHCLIRRYFDLVHPMFPVVNIACFEEMYHRSDAQDRVDSARSRRSFEILLLAIFAIATRHLDSPTGDISEYNSDSFVADAARLHRSMRGRSHPSLCQALLLLGYYSMGIGLLEDSWEYVGMAAQALSFHRAMNDIKSPSGPISYEEQCMQQQIWTGCIVADRFISALIGRPTMIHLQDVDTPPIQLNQPNGDDPSGSRSLMPIGFETTECMKICFNASRSLSTIVGSVLDELYSITRPSEKTLNIRSKRLEYKLVQWVQSLPIVLQIDSRQRGVIPSPVLQLHLQYWWAVILLHRAFIHGPLTQSFYSGPQGTQSKALTVCRDAVDRISSIVTVWDDSHASRFGSAFIPGYLLSAGIIDVLILTTLPNDLQASSRLRRYMTILQRLEGTWPMAKAVQQLLDGTLSSSPASALTSPSLPSARQKRPAGEALGDDDGGPEKKISAKPEPSAQYMKEYSYDNVGRVFGLESGLGFITSEPYPGFQYSPGTASMSSVQPLAQTYPSPESLVSQPTFW